MNERRTSHRHPVPHRIEVFDPVSGIAVGIVVNLSAEGFMLVCPYKVSPGQSLDLLVKLPRKIDDHDDVALKARCIWCRNSSYSEEFGAGFVIDEISEDGRMVLNKLVDELQDRSD